MPEPGAAFGISLLSNQGKSGAASPVYLVQETLLHPRQPTASTSVIPRRGQTRQAGDEWEGPDGGLGLVGRVELDKDRSAFTMPNRRQEELAVYTDHPESCAGQLE